MTKITDINLAFQTDSNNFHFAIWNLFKIWLGTYQSQKTFQIDASNNWNILVTWCKHKITSKYLHFHLIVKIKSFCTELYFKFDIPKILLASRLKKLYIKIHKTTYFLLVIMNRMGIVNLFQQTYLNLSSPYNKPKPYN